MKSELFTNIYFKATLQFFVFASYHVLFRNLRNNFSNNLQCISSLKKDVRILNITIFKIVKNICILTNTNNLFLCYNILKFKDLITYITFF